MTTIADKMRRKGRRRFIETYEFPRALHGKLVSELGDERAADVALDGLRGWYLACLYADGELIGMPSHAVDDAWHEMILMTRQYTYFCERAFGRYLHHTPDSALPVSMDSILTETLAVVDAHDLPMTLFTADEDAGLAHGYVWSSTDLHRMRDAITARTEERRKRRRAASGSSWASGGYVAGGDGGGGGHHGGGGHGGC
ncbi:MAG TPA: hypothetical protein VI300_31125, partial [Solirubrobacter sp.]